MVDKEILDYEARITKLKEKVEKKFGPNELAKIIQQFSEQQQ